MTYCSDCRRLIPAWMWSTVFKTAALWFFVRIVLRGIFWRRRMCEWCDVIHSLYYHGAELPVLWVVGHVVSLVILSRWRRAKRSGVYTLTISQEVFNDLMGIVRPAESEGDSV